MKKYDAIVAAQYLRAGGTCATGIAAMRTEAYRVGRVRRRASDRADDDAARRLEPARALSPQSPRAAVLRATAAAEPLDKEVAVPSDAARESSKRMKNLDSLA